MAHRFERRVTQLEQALPVDFDTLVGRLLEQISDLELAQLLALMEAIRKLPTAAHAQASLLVSVGLRRRAQGLSWSESFTATNTYLVLNTLPSSSLGIRTSHFQCVILGR